MEKVMNLILVIFVFYLVLNVIMYIPRLKCWFGALKPQKRIHNDIRERLAVVIPARNESVVIGELLESLNKQTYDKNCFDVFVIVKEKDDPTIKMINDFGGKVFVCRNQKCKGDALDYCFKKILEDYRDQYKGLVIVDADCILDSRFLEEMNNSLASGCEVCQAKKNVKNYLYKNANSLATCCNGLIWTLIDDMGNRYKSDHGYTNMTIGTGIMLDIDLVRQLGGWPYRETVTEDMEFMNDCAIRGIKTYYNSYSIMYVEEAKSLSMTNKRRTRWLKGLIDSRHIYKERLDDLEGKDNRKNRYYVRALDIAIHYIGGCVLFSFINFSLGIFYSFWGNELAHLAYLYGWIGVLIIYGTFWIMTLFCIICDYKNIKLPWYKKLILLFAHPIFYMGYIPIVAKAICTKRSDKWEAIERVECNN